LPPLNAAPLTTFASLSLSLSANSVSSISESLVVCTICTVLQQCDMTPESRNSETRDVHC
jgi:hypothetical protein